MTLDIRSSVNAEALIWHNGIEAFSSIPLPLSPYLLPLQSFPCSAPLLAGCKNWRSHEGKSRTCALIMPAVISLRARKQQD